MKNLSYPAGEQRYDASVCVERRTHVTKGIRPQRGYRSCVNRVDGNSAITDVALFFRFCHRASTGLFFCSTTSEREDRDYKVFEQLSTTYSKVEKMASTKP